MPVRVFLDKDKKKYKGQLHCHSTRSDGVLLEREVFEKYKSKGYNFVLLSDHNVYWNSSQYDSKDFISLSGCEVDVNTGGYPNEDFHFLNISSGKTVNEYKHSEIIDRETFKNMDTVQDVLNKIQATGNVAILNHPAWSRNKYDISELDGYFAMEIYNHCSEVEECCGYALDYWDMALRSGKRILGVATDDSHNYSEKILSKKDFNGGWIQLETDELTQEKVIENMIRGNFYSSSGPKIYDLRVVYGTIYIECSPVSKINFKTSHMRGVVEYPVNNLEKIEKAEYKIRSIDEWVRVECVDEFGNIAWSNPIFIKDII